MVLFPLVVSASNHERTFQQSVIALDRLAKIVLVSRAHARLRTITNEPRTLARLASTFLNSLGQEFRNMEIFTNPPAVAWGLTRRLLCNIMLLFTDQFPFTSNPRLLPAVASWESWVNKQSIFAISRIESAVAK